VLHELGGGVCFLLNSVSFLAVIGSLLRMKLPPFVRSSTKKNAFVELREGWTYLMRTPSISRPILMLAAMSLFVIPYATLLPIYAREIFHGTALTFGWIDSFVGVGAIGGALFMASRKSGSDSGRRKILRTNTIIFGLGLIGFSYMTNFWIAMIFAVISGFGMLAQTTVTNTIIQTRVAPGMRGRVISYFAMSYFGMMPLGSLLVGGVSHYIGAPNTILAEGVVALIVVWVFWSSYLKPRTVVKATREMVSEATAAPAQPAPAPQVQAEKKVGQPI
ncbi:MAG TPA: MFS transporter, partial [Puia sp.]